MKRWLLGAVGLAALCGVAFAQPVTSVPQVGVITQFNTQKSTFSAVSIGLVPAASATDVYCIAGAAGVVVKLEELTLSGSAGTLVTVPVVLLRRTSVDTGGTAASTIANPANTIAKNDTNDGTAAATLIAYTANPTIVDASPTYLRAGNVTLPVTSAGTSTVPLMWSFGNRLFDKAPTLRGAAQQICVNLQATSITSGVVNVSSQWTEE